MRLVRQVALILLVACACGAPTPAPTPAPKPAVVAFTSPGPLIAAHATLACADCHIGATPEVVNDKCVGCHEHGDLRARITAGRGFHATPQVRGKLCVTCHLDHKGAGFDAIGWRTVKGGQRGFDHALTGWPLDGAHALATCESCHTARSRGGQRKFLGVDRLCGACHETQPHGFARREMLACDRCHGVAAWSAPKRILDFDHDDRKDARMPLVGQHRKLACSTCHPAALFDSPLDKPEQCESCHRSPHAGQVYGRLGCAACHGEQSFKVIAGFDHGERTRFDLGASHRMLACATCHTTKLASTAPLAACETCHVARAPHKDRFKAFGAPPACAVCHAPSTEFDPQARVKRRPWKPNRFDHGKHTGWPLTAKHATLTCRQCHRGATPATFEKLASGAACMDCHEHKAVHADAAHPKGQFTNAQCIQCHVR